MMPWRQLVWLLSAGLAACSAGPEKDTLADLHRLEPELTDVTIEDSLERAEASYRRYLEETPSRAMAPEAMRRMADLQIEQEFGLIGSGELIEVAADESAMPVSAEPPVMAPKENARLTPSSARAASGLEQDFAEEQATFEQRAAVAYGFTATQDADPMALPEMAEHTQPDGPADAIKIYQKILDEFPGYERNDQVLYQMSRAYDELGQSENAMAVMVKLINDYPDSKYADEVNFRRGEYFFVRKQYLDAEEAYQAITRVGAVSQYYELALYKLGWTLYKQDFYEEALDRYITMLDYRLSIGFDFDEMYEEDDEHRVADTLRVISLSFSNLGGPKFIDEYFAANGSRSYADSIYSNLGEFHLDKLRYQDAAAVYNSFIDLNPYHRVAPNFSMRVVEIFEAGDFLQLVVESKKDFAQRYAVQAEYWQHYDVAEATEVMGFLKTNLKDLATHYHALYQDELLVDERPTNYAEALRWYRQFLSSFPGGPDSPPTNYQLADLLLEHGDFGQAAFEYARTAYDYPRYEKSAAAGYAAVYAYRQHLEVVSGALKAEVKLAAVESSLRFVETFPEHEEASPVLGAAADDLYVMQDFDRAISSARQLIEQYPESDRALLRSAWIVVAHSSIDIAEFPAAEEAYVQVLALTAPEDESRPAITDGLAAAIYKQGEQANLLEDYRGAADHFLRIRDVAPGSAIAVSATYDGAVVLVRLEDWNQAAIVFEEFRTENPEHALAADATKQLAVIYRQNAQTERAAAEHIRIADESADPELAREALLVAADLYKDVGNNKRELAVYERYVAEYPSPVDVALESRTRMAEIYLEGGGLGRYHEELRTIVATDATAGEERSARTRYLAARAALVLAELIYQHFAALDLLQPFEQSLAEKQARMDTAMAALEGLVNYEVGEVTAAATYYIAEIYFNFSQALLESERPDDLGGADKASYELILEEEAYPFEEQAIDVHQENFELLRAGLFNPWVQKSMEKLALLMPGRYAKAEVSSGFLGSIDYYAYRVPVVPEVQPGKGYLPSDEATSEQTAIPSPDARVTQISESF
jgi:TolA-binding protein